MNKYAVKKIVPGSIFSGTVFLDDGFILGAEGTPFAAETARALLIWGFPEVLSDGSPSLPARKSPQTGKDVEQLQKAEIFLEELQSYVEKIFAKASNDDNPNLTFNGVAERIKEVVEIIRKDKNFLLRSEKMSIPASEQNYLASHSVKSAVVAIVIGLQLRIPAHRIIELGVAALLHEIGMMRLPPEIYLGRGALGPMEKRAILSHPILGYKILKAAEFPLDISIAALEHHERENGSGYPQKLSGDKISLYAKIIAVACSYEAQTSARPYKDPKDGYSGMVDLLKNEGKQYDDTIIRALVYSLSIYPVGLYVLLSNKQKAQVVDVNPEKVRFPVVQVFPGNGETIQTAENGIFILRPLSKEEIP